MRIAMIGGLDRNERLFEQLAATYGHELEFHGGHMSGRGAGELRSLVERAELVVLTPDVNSHGAVQLGKKAARESERPFVVLRTCGVSRFRALLDALATRQAA
ncbi:DUF2325 domain-containing protein [Vulgatibacter sp.]|uniref:DUF2325 domain-containing protein n=1 Tax=Vulgatibacter sp. TaxID=1971226 RepID=UPI003561E8FB